MVERIQRIASPGATVALILCLLFPLVWNRFFPAFEGDAANIQLTMTRPDDEIEVPGSSMRAVRKEFTTQRNEQFLAFAFELERAGRYSIYGISSNRDANPLDLRMNGRSVSTTAFYQKTGSLRNDFEKHLIARAVSLVAGENVASIAGVRARNRTVFLELRREAPLHPLRYAALFMALACLLAVRRFVSLKFPLPPRARLAAAALAYAAVLAAFPAALLALSDGHLVPLGEKDPVKSRHRRLLEEHLRSEKHRRAREEKFSVFVMGDSTHYWLLPDPLMLPLLERALPAGEKDEIALYGIAAGALNAFDFYLLLNRIARERPDVVVIPVSLRSFSDWWLHDRGNRFSGFDHYLQPAEFLRAWNLSVAGREVPLVGWLLRRLDARCFDRRAAQLLRGGKVFFESESERLRRGISETVLAAWEPVSEEVQLKANPRYRRWNTDIAVDHPLLPVYRLINDLAARHGIEVLYYTEQVNVEAQREKGKDLRVRENFAVIESAIAGDAGVHFLMLSDEIPPEMFSDDLDHLTPKGIAGVAAAIAREIAALKRTSEGRWRRGAAETR
jgi:hypothetical protein